MENHTAKHFVLQLGSLASLYLSLSFLLVLLFGLINLIFPDAADSVWQVENASGMVRIGIAMVVVFFPTYLILTRLVNVDRRKNPQGSYLGLTKWLIYLSLLVGGAVLLGDLVAVIIGFLDGELTQRYLLKALAVLIVIGSAFYYYICDAKGYWLKEEKKSITFGIGAAVIVLIIVVAGFTHIDAPSQVHENKLDQTQVSDLQDIQWRIADYLALNEVLPESLEDLEGGELPQAPEERPAYTYEQTEKGFKLCATFSQASKRNDYYYGRPSIAESNRPMILNPDNWSYQAGDVCFERVVQSANEKSDI